MSKATHVKRGIHINCFKTVTAGLVVWASVALAPSTLLGDPIAAGGYTFTNFNFPNGGNTAGAGTNVNGIANNGDAVGVSISDAGTFTNFVRNSNGTFTPISLNGTAPMAFGINSAGDVVGQQNGAAFLLPHGGSAEMLTTPAGATSAFGINDNGNIVGQFTAGSATPGFVLGSSGAITINAPAGPNTVNAQGINNSQVVVGFYVGTDGQDHGFVTNASRAVNGSVTGTPVADPTIPKVPNEPGATFVFSQILGVNDHGIAVGYYGDSTTSQHGFLYNLSTGAYTFLDDPSEKFDNGVEVTQITGINNSGQIAGFYSDGSGVFHGFVATPTPEPSCLILAGFGLGVLGLSRFRRRRNAQEA